MNPYDPHPNEISFQSQSLHRSKATADLSHLLSRRQGSLTVENRSSQPDSRRSVENASENSQILYMSASRQSKRRRANGRSLSSIGNGAGRRADGSIDEPTKEQDDHEDAMSRHIIDQEILEWQYVCQTGRPYWWSPQSKYGRLQKLQQRMASEHESATRGYTMKSAPLPQTAVRRHAISDSYLAEPCDSHDLAHLVAVQLLGACFTLPPEAITAVPPKYTRDDDGASMLRDPQLISSLRMHTQFRYSPSFGHQARNTSPVQLWPGRYDGPKSGSSPSQNNTGSSTPNIGTSSPCSRRHRMHGALQNTEGSDTRHDDDDDEDYIRTDPTVGACAWYKRQGVHDSNKHSFKSPHMPGATSRRLPTHTPERSREEHAVTRSPVGPSPRTAYRLQPVIRSEPHHVFIQPVRELVVKRWKNFRRRLSGSLHSSLPTGSLNEVDSASESSASEASSPMLSSDAKVRRLRAQERGDIHSSSAESSPRYNTPISGNLSPSYTEATRATRQDSQNASPSFPLADPLAAAASLAAAELTQQGSLGPSTSESASKGITPLSQNSFSSQRSSQRSRGKVRTRSMLSEVCTPEDFRTQDVAGPASRRAAFDRNVLSAAGSALASPREEQLPGFPFPGRRTDGTLSSPGPVFPPTVGVGEFRASSVQPRPRIARTSTSGTQVFTPNDNGVEVDGLPSGPSRDLWQVKGGRRERTFL